MVKIIFGVLFVGALYYVIIPLLGKRVNWVDAEDPLDEKLRELDLEKRINLKALKDIEFELASGKINDGDYLDLKEHYSRKVSRILYLIEVLEEEEKEAAAAHHGRRERDDPPVGEGFSEDERDPGEDELDEDEDELEENEMENDELEMDEDELDEDDGEGWDEVEEDEYDGRRVKRLTLAVIALALAVGTGFALFQMGKRSAARGPVALAPPAPAVSLPSSSSDQAGLEYLVQYVQENPWNVTSHLILGEYYLDAGDTGVALAHFLSAEGIKPGDGRVLSDLGKTYRKLGNTDQAIEKFQAAIDAEPDALEYLYQLGLIYSYEKGDRTQARELFKEIITRQPDEELQATVKKELRKLGEETGS